MKNETLKYKIATLFLKEIASMGRLTQISYLHDIAKRDLKQEMPESDERYFNLYVDSAVELLKAEELIMTDDKEKFADLTEEGLKAAQHKSISQYFAVKEKKIQRKAMYEIGSKIATVLSAIIAAISLVIGFITKDIKVGLLVATFFVGAVIGFAINGLIKRTV